MDVKKMDWCFRRKVTPGQLDKLKGLERSELLDYTWIPLDRLDHTESGDDYLYIADRGNDINGEVIDNSIVFTTQEFEMTQKDKIFLDA